MRLIKLGVYLYWVIPRGNIRLFSVSSHAITKEGFRMDNSFFPQNSIEIACYDDKDIEFLRGFFVTKGYTVHDIPSLTLGKMEFPDFPAPIYGLAVPSYSFDLKFVKDKEGLERDIIELRSLGYHCILDNTNVYLDNKKLIL